METILGGGPIPPVLYAAHSPMVLGRLHLPVCIPPGCPCLEPFPFCKSFLAVSSRHREGTTPLAPQTCCPALAEREELGSQLSYTPSTKFAHSEPTVRGVFVSRMTMPGGSDGWERDTFSATPCTLIPDVVLKARDGKLLSCQPASWWSSISIFPLIQCIYNKQWEIFLSKNLRGSRWTTS